MFGTVTMFDTLALLDTVIVCARNVCLVTGAGFWLLVAASRAAQAFRWLRGKFRKG